MRTTMILLTACLVSCRDATAPVQTVNPTDAVLAEITSRENVVLPLNLTAFNPCTNENVLVTGEVHLVSMTNVKPNGEISEVFHTNFVNATGVGLSSGDSYRATSAESAPFQGVFPGGPWRSTHEGTLHLVTGPGGSNFLLHFVFVVTKDPGVPPSIIVFKFNVSCS